MNYGLGIAGDARVDLQAMDSWLQEEFWDELEQLAADPSRLPSYFGTSDVSYEFRRDHGGVRHLIRTTSQTRCARWARRAHAKRVTIAATAIAAPEVVGSPPVARANDSLVRRKAGRVKWVRKRVRLMAPFFATNSRK